MAKQRRAPKGTYTGLSKPEYMRIYYANNKDAIRNRQNKRKNSTVRGRMHAIRSNASLRAKKKGWEFDLTLDALELLWTAQEGRCALTGVPMSLAKGESRWDSALCSLDRIDPAKGYTLDNVQLTTAKANYGKGMQTMEDFVEMCKQVVERHG